MRIGVLKTYLFFYSRGWDSFRGDFRCCMGHCPSRRQEPRVDRVAVHATGLAGAADDADTGQFGEMAGHRALAEVADLGELADRRPALAGTVGERDQTLQGPAQMRLQRAVQGEIDGHVIEHLGVLRAHPPRGKNQGLAFCRQLSEDQVLTR